MRFWDASAVLPLLVQELASAEMRALFAADPEMIVWWGTEVECVSALARVERAGPAAVTGVRQGLARLDGLRGRWHEVQPVSAVRTIARRFLRVHALRAADALQLAAAVLAAEDRPASLEVVTLDRRLYEAAAREGFALPQAPIA